MGASSAIDSSMKRALGRLQRLLPGKAAADVPMSKYTTMRVGGPAAILADADRLSDLKVIMETVGDYELPLLILGRGSNLLVGDLGFPGVVLRLGGDFRSAAQSGSTITAGAAVSLASLVQITSKSGLGGLDFAVGIPGTLGAAVAVNAGAYGADMGSIVVKITVLTRGLDLVTWRASELWFEYRRCRLPEEAVILEASLGLYPANVEALKYRMETNWRRRRRKQPLDLPSAGSMFKNPPGDYAGRLIEAAGLKGERIGGALVSEKHANFFVNAGGATAGEFYRLMRLVSLKVEDQFGVRLEPEVRVVGEWADDRG